jgi:peptidoglycan/xylan/chitin deacetylase (PgdA/CDA1 family)
MTIRNQANRTKQALISAIALLLPTACGTNFENQSSLSDFVYKPIRGADLPEHTFALTFDDGPGEGSVEFATFLAEQDIPATFFVVGEAVEKNLDAARQIKSLGHTIGNHTYSHPQMAFSLDPLGEISKTDAVLADVLGDGPFFFRAPYGNWSPHLPFILNNSAMKKYIGSISWDIGGLLTDNFATDWDCWRKRITPEECGERYLNEMKHRRSGIVLAHDIHRETIEMFKRIVPRMKALQYKFVTIEHVPKIAAQIR